MLGGFAGCLKGITSHRDEATMSDTDRSLFDEPAADNRFNFVCGACGSVLEAAIKQSGSPGRCPSCGALFDIPRVDRRTGMVRKITVGAAPLSDPTPVHAYAAAGVQAPDIVRQPDGSLQIVCRRCGQAGNIQEDYCRTCGFPFTLEGANRAASDATHPLAALALGLGILAIPLAVCTNHWGALGGLLSAALSWAALDRIGPSGRRTGRTVAYGALACAVLSLSIAAATSLW